MKLREQVLQQPDSFWRSIGCNAAICSDTVVVDVVFSPHKMKYNDEGMESVAAGANDRADFYLVATSPKVLAYVELGCLYHTTNVPKNAFSDRSDVVAFESRLLYVGCEETALLLDVVVSEMSRHVRQRSDNAVA